MEFSTFINIKQCHAPMTLKYSQMNQKKLFHEKYIEPELVNIYDKVVEDSLTIISLERIDYLVNVKRMVTLTY